jgi:hypothetical protein
MGAFQIVAALRMDRADAPGKLFDAYGGELIAYCWRMLRSDDATVVAVRDTMIVAQAHAGRLRDPELLGPWLLALARIECERRMPEGAGKSGEAGGAPPAPDRMRDEILACLTDPAHARYRAVSAARVPPLHADGFPSRRGALVARRPRWPGPRLNAGQLWVGAAISAVVILLAAGFSLGGGSSPSSTASASLLAGGAGDPALANSATAQPSPVGRIRLVQLPDPPVTRAHAPARRTQQAVSGVGSQPGPSGLASAGRQSGGQAVQSSLPVRPAMPALLPTGDAPALDSARHAISRPIFGGHRDAVGGYAGAYRPGRLSSGRGARRHWPF